MAAVALEELVLESEPVVVAAAKVAAADALDIFGVAITSAAVAAVVAKAVKKQRVVKR